MSEQWPSKEQEIWFQAGVTGERQRIIKLLEETITNWRKCDLHQQADLFDHAIELIKGATNE